MCFPYVALGCHLAVRVANGPVCTGQTSSRSWQSPGLRRSGLSACSLCCSSPQGARSPKQAVMGDPTPAPPPEGCQWPGCPALELAPLPWLVLPCGRNPISSCDTGFQVVSKTQGIPTLSPARSPGLRVQLGARVPLIMPEPMDTGLGRQDRHRALTLGNTTYPN